MKITIEVELSNLNDSGNPIDIVPERFAESVKHLINHETGYVIKNVKIIEDHRKYDWNSCYGII